MQRFFKTKPGQYGAGDLFLGISVPVLRNVARKYAATITPETIAEFLASPWHEVRFLALVWLVQKSEKAKTDTERRTWADFYLQHRTGVNNWDLVDISAPQILGCIAEESPEILWSLARSGKLWEERIAVVATLYEIRRKRFPLTLSFAEHFLSHTHDLIHKATGWMLREMGKRDVTPLIKFLNAHAAVMPRTMLRYSMEKLPPQTRTHYLGQKQKFL